MAPAARSAGGERCMSWQVITGDCVEELPKLPQSSARLVFLDPPYGIGIDYGEGAKADRFGPGGYEAFLRPAVAAAVNMMAPDGSLWLLISDEHAAEACVLVKRWLVLKNWVKWYESFGVNCTKRFNRCTRHLFHFVADPKRSVFHPGAVRVPSARLLKYNDKRANPEGKLLDDCWRDIPRLCGTFRERIKGFPTQLPVRLLERVVAVASDPGDLVVDPFCGSGTAGAACLRLGRRFIGVERNPEFARLASERLAKEQEAVAS